VDLSSALACGKPAARLANAIRPSALSRPWRSVLVSSSTPSRSRPWELLLVSAESGRELSQFAVCVMRPNVTEASRRSVRSQHPRTMLRRRSVSGCDGQVVGDVEAAWRGLDVDGVRAGGQRRDHQVVTLVDAGETVPAGWPKRLPSGTVTENIVDSSRYRPRAPPARVRSSIAAPRPASPACRGQRRRSVGRPASERTGRSAGRPDWSGRRSSRGWRERPLPPTRRPLVRASQATALR
jgi:hypothetical protein